MLQSRFLRGRVCQVGGCVKTHHNVGRQLSMNFPEMSTTSFINKPRPLPWLRPGMLRVDYLMNLGHGAIRAATCHMATAWGTRNFSPNLYNRLIPQAYLWRPLPPDAPQLSPPLLLVHPQIALLEPSARPVPLMDAYDLTEWWLRKIYSEHNHSHQMRGNFTEPDRLVLDGVSHLRNELQMECQDTPEIGCCLTMIGAGTLAIIGATPCDLCNFRNSVNGTSRCGACSRSKRVVDPEDEQVRAAKARRSRAIRAVTSMQPAQFDQNVESLVARSISSILYSMTPGCEAHNLWKAEVEAALSVAPMVERSLPRNFLGLKHWQQVNALQTAIDPNEWDYAAWPKKIAWAQAWASGKAHVDSRRKLSGVTGKTMECAEQARALLNTGESKTAIANRLGISLSNLSHILRRASNGRSDPTV